MCSHRNKESVIKQPLKDLCWNCRNSWEGGKIDTGHRNFMCNIAGTFFPLVLWSTVIGSFKDLVTVNTILLKRQCFHHWFPQPHRPSYALCCSSVKWTWLAGREILFRSDLAFLIAAKYCEQGSESRHSSLTHSLSTLISHSFGIPPTKRSALWDSLDLKHQPWLLARSLL